MPTDRLEREAEFHNKAFTEQSRAQVGKFYAITRTSKQRYRDIILKYGRGKRALEYGCGPGSHAFELAQQQAQVIGIDIADEAIELARQMADLEKVSGQTSFEVMNAEALSFADGQFDLICGSGILHHLDLPQALSEVTRVLASDGKGVFFEPLGHNPFINLYRRLTPNLRTEDEHPLLVEDLKKLEEYFAEVKVHYFYFFALLAVPFLRFPGGSFILNALESLDKILFRIPFLRKQAWIVVIELAQPQKPAPQGRVQRLALRRAKNRFYSRPVYCSYTSPNLPGQYTFYTCFDTSQRKHPWNPPALDSILHALAHSRRRRYPKLNQSCHPGRRRPIGPRRPAPYPPGGRFAPTPGTPQHAGVASSGPDSFPAYTPPRHLPSGSASHPTARRSRPPGRRGLFAKSPQRRRSQGAQKTAPWS